MTTLIPIGGALDLDRASVVWRTFVDRAGGRAGRFVIIPTASALPDTAQRYVEALRAAGVRKHPIGLPLRTRAEAHDRSAVAAIKKATGVFITGGNQVRLTATLGGTPVLEALLEAYQRGAVIAGSSAGAACMSAVMIAFGRDGAMPRQGMAQFAPGLGFTSRVIVDQHFRQRDRLGRLLFAVAQQPGTIGLGVDENTAAIIEDDRFITVIGQHAVTIVDGADLTATDVAEVAGAGPIGMCDARVHVLTHGGTFELDRRMAALPAKALKVD
jgi:cyanophycinase